jgi:hypothetical protein
MHHALMRLEMFERIAAGRWPNRITLCRSADLPGICYQHACVTSGSRFTRHLHAPRPCQVTQAPDFGTSAYQ